MKSLILFISISVFISTACQQKKEIISESTSIIDSAFIGEPKIIRREFLNILQSEDDFKAYDVIKKSLEKFEKKCYTLNNSKDIQLNNLTFRFTKPKKHTVRLYTIINHKIIDSLMVYQNESDINFEDQKFGTLFYLENGKNLWTINVLINTIEQAVTIVSYKKYKISQTGKIIKEDIYIENKSLQQIFQNKF